MSSNLTGSTINGNISRIVVSHVTGDLPAHIPSVYTTTSHRIDILPPSRRTAGRDAPLRHTKAAAMEPQFRVVEHDVRNASLLLEMHAAWMCYLRFTFTSNILENKNVTGEQSIDEQVYELNINRVRLVNNPRVRSSFAASQQGHFQVPTSAPCYSLGVANFCNACFVVTLARWIFARETSSANPAFRNVLEFWGTRAPMYIYNSLDRNFYYEHVVVSHMGLLLVLKICESRCQKNTRFLVAAAVASGLFEHCIAPVS